MSRTKKKTIVFYTEEELQLIKEYINNGRKDYKNVNALARKLRRPRSGVYAKYNRMKKELKVPSARKTSAPGMLNLEAKKIMNVPKGMILEFPASKIHMEEGKITLFF